MLVTNIIINLINGSEGYVVGLLVMHGSCALCIRESGDAVTIDIHLLIYEIEKITCYYSFLV